MTKIFLVRHGEKISERGNPHLTKTGLEQAQKTAEYFVNLSIDKIISSPMLRTKETAEIIANKLGLAYILSPALRERINWEDNSRQSFAEFMSMWNKSTRDRNWQPPVGDSSINAGKRLESYICKQINLQNESILFVTHGGIITDYLRNNFSDSELNKHLNNFSEKLDAAILECSITCLTYSEASQKPNIKYLACTDHLKS